MPSLRKKRLAIIGNGMATSRLLDELLKRDGGSMFDIRVFGEEQHGCYNRILLGQVLAGRSLDDITLKPSSWYQDNRVELRSGSRVKKLDTSNRKLVADDGTEFSYDAVVFATGSSPTLPTLDGVKDVDGKLKPGAFLFRTAEDSQALRDRARPASSAIILGGGSLGLEAAKTLSDMGLHVTVVHRSQWLMNQQLDRIGGGLLRESIEKQGIFVRTGTSAAAVIGDEEVEGVRLENGEVLSADLLVAAIGVTPRVDVAAKSGIPVNRGILVNDLLATSTPGVFAVGECAEHNGKTYGIVAPIWDQCEVLADILTGANPSARYRGSKVYVRLKVAGIEVASMGIVDAQYDSDEVVQVIEERRKIYRKLIIREGKLIGAMVVGSSESAPSLVRWYDRGDSLPKDRLDVLRDAQTVRGGSSVAASEDPEICKCHRICRSTILDSIRSGATTLPEVSATTKAGTGCGSCRGQLADLILKNAPRSTEIAAISSR